jgi:hypothetical protein
VFGLCSDKTRVISWGQRTYHPIYMHLLNYAESEAHPFKVGPKQKRLWMIVVVEMILVCCLLNYV